MVFETSVYLMGSNDTSWKAVRHAVQDEQFCNKLAGLKVPKLSVKQINNVKERLEVRNYLSNSNKIQKFIGT